MAILFIVVFVAIFGGFIFLGLRGQKQRRESVWSGVVIDKNIRENVERDNLNNDGNSGTGIQIMGVGNGGYNQPAITHSYSIAVKTDSGEQIDWPVSSGLYEAISIGDKLNKPAGTEIPEIVQKAQAATQPATPVTQQPMSNGPQPPIPPLPPVQPPSPPTTLQG